MAGVDGSNLCSVEKCRREDGLVHLQFDIQLEAVTIPHGVLQPAEDLAGFGDPVDNLIVDSHAVGMCASEISRIIYCFELMAVDRDSTRTAVLRIRVVDAYARVTRRQDRVKQGTEVDL
nr:unnamed protein product [Spirometra erinaceieuropaei]